MATLDETPTFNLKAVVQETGIKPDTLRAWERRYGLPQPARSSGGHRLYSQHDIDTLKWLMERQEEGLSISRAVDLWNQLVGEGKDPFWEMGDEEADVAAPPRLEVGDTLAELRQSWIEACLAYDEQRAEYTLSQAFALYAPETACIELLQKGLSQIGELWYDAEATPQQEHFASALAIRRLEALLAAAPPPTRPARVLIGCPPEEEHTFSSLLLTLFLRRRGWDTIYLGANVPLERLERTVERTKPALVVLSAQTLNTAGTMLTMAEFVQEMQVPLAFGGLVFNQIPDLAAHVPGHFLGARLDEAPNRIEQLLTSPIRPQKAVSASDAYDKALEQFQRRQPYIESYIWDQADMIKAPAAYLARANYGLAQGIIAALKLGEMAFLGHDLAWVRGLLSNHNFPLSEEVLREFLALYRDAAARHLEGAADVIVSWLDEVVSKDHL
ncbi:MAG TPA: MerR family transcriptional regulator [Candidatus Binatia bacterium]|nr:MerR family transcriptional regulator [Candidatus Binatia bacterium]